MHARTHRHTHTYKHRDTETDTQYTNSYIINNKTGVLCNMWLYFSLIPKQRDTLKTYKHTHTLTVRDEKGVKSTLLSNCVYTTHSGPTGITLIEQKKKEKRKSPH